MRHLIEKMEQIVRDDSTHLSEGVGFNDKKDFFIVESSYAERIRSKGYELDASDEYPSHKKLLEDAMEMIKLIRVFMSRHGHLLDKKETVMINDVESLLKQMSIPMALIKTVNTRAERDSALSKSLMRGLKRGSE